MECERQRQVKRYIENIPKMIKKKRAMEKALSMKKSNNSFKKTLRRNSEAVRVSATGR